MPVAVSADKSDLRVFLARAAETPMEIEELAARWRVTRILVGCRGAAGLAGNPNTPGRIRGAWLSALRETASPLAADGQACLWSPPCAYDVFHNSQGCFPGVRELPKPFVLSLDVLGRDLLIMLSLFGVAGDWAGEAGDALLRGLRRGLDGRHGRRPLDVTGRSFSQSTGVSVNAGSDAVVMQFLSPVVLRQRQDEHLRPAALLKSLAIRIAGLGLWHGIALRADAPTLSAQAEGLGDAAEWHVQDAQAWRRGMPTQGRSAIVAGVRGTLWLPPPPPFFAAIVSLGETAHAGSRTALGFGRYTLSTVTSG